MSTQLGAALCRKCCWALRMYTNHASILQNVTAASSACNLPIPAGCCPASSPVAGRVPAPGVSSSAHVCAAAHPFFVRRAVCTPALYASLSRSLAPFAHSSARPPTPRRSNPLPATCFLVSTASARRGQFRLTVAQHWHMRKRPSVAVHEQGMWERRSSGLRAQNPQRLPESRTAAWPILPAWLQSLQVWSAAGLHGLNGHSTRLAVGPSLLSVLARPHVLALQHAAWQATCRHQRQQQCQRIRRVRQRTGQSATTAASCKAC